MGSDGGLGKRVGWVWVTYGRERERKGSRERPRAALYSEAVAQRGRGLRVPAEMAAVAAGGGSGLSAALVGVAQVEGKERESGGVAERRACGLAHSGSRAALAHVLLEVRERERGGGQNGGVICTSRHLDWREGEARGGGGARRQRSGAC